MTMTSAQNSPGSGSIRHHPGDELLLAYAAGSLPEAVNLMVATHVSLCDDCRAQLEACEALGGVVLEKESADLSSQALDRALAALDHVELARVPAPRHAACPVLPQPLLAYVGGGVNKVKWRSIGMGVKQSILKTGPGASARLLYIPAGASVPEHTHRGMELTMVLQGAFSDEIDRFTRGDVETADTDVAHTPVADPGEDCICLAVADAPLKFNGLIPRMLQPFLRI